VRSLLLAALVALVAVPTALGGISAHGELLQIAGHKSGPTNANQSINWFGYNQGSVEQGGKLFSSITGDWVVPKATSHFPGQDQYSSDWIGIGGGCVDADCFVGDTTLIQTGTEQDVDSSGQASYSAWWEVIPGPSLTITGMTIAPGDHMHAAIAETLAGSNLWTITLQDVTRNETYTITIPYSSTHLTAEWIEETPLVIDTSGSGFAALPNLTKVPFDLGTVNGAPANLTVAEEIQLVDANSGAVIGAPSAPDRDVDGFAACAWATSCRAPSS
jgi:hypothetical protein